MSEGEIQKLVEMEKAENAEMTTKYKAILEKYSVSQLSVYLSMLFRRTYILNLLEIFPLQIQRIVVQ